ncbi:hypothetical protein AB0B45_50650 [Nonomuraea sp. NPDC049152]|uniref:hypothetical protein n=1 Tax=Nonomuraea sp. NPDC049152 TaxID=3154350 RepID=UPI0033D9ED23
MHRALRRYRLAHPDRATGARNNDTFAHYQASFSAALTWTVIQPVTATSPEASRALSQALDRADDDPRLVELADKLAAYLTRMADERGEDYVDDTDIESPLVKLMDMLAFGTVPPARRLIELLKQRGWTGWTKLERVDPTPGAAPR